MGVININNITYNKLEETELIKRILKGEKGLYEILVKRNNQKLYRIIRGYIRDEAEIEDIMQNSYIKAYTKLYQFQTESSFSTWLIRIGINESLGRIKEKGRLINLNQQPENVERNVILEIPDKNQLNPQDKMIRNEAKKLLENSIDHLDCKYKTVYIMKEIEEMSLKEIAIALDLTVANVKVRLHRSKEMLKDKLFEISNDKSIFEFGFSRCDRITGYVMSMI